MEWEGRRESENVEDQRAMTPGRVAVGGGIGALVLAVVVYFLGGDPQQVLNQIQQNPEQAPAVRGATDPAQEKLSHFVRVVLADTEDVWKAQFQKMGKTYKEPHLVLFSHRVESACGM